MSNNVFAATMTLDGAPYLAASAKVSQATALSEAQLKRLDAQVLAITNALKPLATIAAVVQRQFDLVRGSTIALNAANAPVQASLSATAAALLGLNSERATAGLSRTALMLSNITSQADTAAGAVAGLNDDLEGTSAAEGEVGGQEKTEAETPAAPERHEHPVVGQAVATAIGAKAGTGNQVEGLTKIEDEEKKVEVETKHVADSVDHLTQALTHNASEAGHVAAASQHAGTAVKEAGKEIEKVGEKSAHTKKEINELGRGFEGLGEGVRKTAEIMRDMLIAMPEVAALVGVLAGVGEAVAKIREAFTYGDQLAALSRQTGETATTLAQLRRTFEYFDVSADEVGHTLFMLQKSLGGVSEAGEPTAEAFARLGLNIGELRKMDAGQQFSAIMIGLQKLPDQATKSAIAMKIFGRSAMEVQAILNASPADFAASMADAAEYAQVMGQNAAAFEDIERKFFVFREQIETIFARIAAGLIPAVEKLLDLVNKIDFSKWGTAITNVMGIITNGIGNGDLGKIFGLTLELGAIDALQAVVGLVLGMAEALVAVIKGIFSKDLWTSLASGFKGVAEAFGAALLGALEGPINVIQSSIEYLFGKKNAKDAMAKDEDNVTNDAGDVRYRREWYETQLARLKRGEIKPDDPTLKSAKFGYEQANKLLGADTDQLQKDTQMANGSLGDYIQANINRPATLFGQTQTDLQGQSDKDIGAATPGLTAFKDAVIGGFKKGQDEAKGSSMFDTSGIQAQLNALIQKNLPKTTPEIANKNTSAPGATMARYDYKLPEGDRLAKIGGFLGGSPAAPGLSEARRTAAATERMAKRMDQIGSIGMFGTREFSPRYQ